ncbi:MAG: GGDEF domain-containing protein [Thermodesulfobacteriota bacterium]
MKRISYQLAVPVLLLILSVVLIWQWSGLASYMSKEEELHALLTILPALPYLLFSLLVVIGWRYNNAGLIFSCLVLGFGYFVFALKPAALQDTPLALMASFLLPFNLLFSSFYAKKRIFTPFGAIWAGLIVLQVCLVLLICAPLQYELSSPWRWLSRSMPGFAAIHGAASQKILAFLASQVVFNLQAISTTIFLAYLLPFILLGYRFLRNLDIALTGYMGTLVALLLALVADNSVSGLMICFSTAGIIMLITTIEASYSMAYLDELTGLRGRRSLNELMLNLGKTYAIAMLDIDHFKKFNDTYGHKTGDDVLKMVATVFSKIRGNAKTFRYGGEEFTAVFPGKTAEEAQPYLEKIRRDIEESGFVVRSKTRKKKSAENRGKDTETKKTVSVTISIGAATSSKKLDSPEKVIKAADAILYKAKKAGRNRVKIG